MPLTAPPLTELTADSGLRAVFAEWLGKWFDGAAHAVGAGAAVVFPRALLAFGEGLAAAQPLEDLPEIRLVCLPRNELALRNVDANGAGNRVFSRVLFQFWVSARKPGPGQAQSTAQSTAQLLKAALTNPVSRQDLGACGIFKLQPRQPEAVPDRDYAKFLVACPAELQYAVLFDDQAAPGGTVPAVSAGVPTGMLPFFRELALAAGDDLAGNYTLTAPVRVLRVRVRALASQNSATVLRLLDLVG